jgi:hypothetical protein
MPDLATLRRDLLAFSIAIGQPLADWQADSLSLDRRTTTIVAPRQSGKSRALGVLALHRAFARPDQRVLVISAGEDASRRLLAEAAAVAVRSPLLSGSVVDENAGLLVLSNGSEIRSVPASERAIRGWSTDLLLIDEAAQVDDDLILGAALPTTAARPQARIVLAGSPGSPEGVFYDFAESESESVAVSRWSLEDAVWIAPEVVEQAREQLPPSVFAREMEGRFTDAGDETVIPREWIAEAQARSLQPGPVLFGADVARGGDETVMLRLAGGVARVAWANHDSDLMRTAGRIAQSARDERGPGPAVWLDVTGLGYGIYDRLRELAINVQPFVASARAERPERHLNLRAQAWFLTREVFRLGEIDLDPEDKLLASQLASQRFTIASGGQLQIAEKKGAKSPDRADALVIAVHAAAQRWRGEQMTRLLAEFQRDAERAGGPRESTEAEYAADGGPMTEVAWGESPRGGWKERLGWDDDLPTIR